MAKYLVETYYTCTFKVNHYLDEVNEMELKNLEKRDDGKFEVLDVKLDNRKTKSLDPKNNKVVEEKKADVVSNNIQSASKNLENIIQSKNSNSDNNGKRFSMPDRRKGYIQKATIGDHKAAVPESGCSYADPSGPWPNLASPTPRMGGYVWARACHVAPCLCTFVS